MTKKQTIGVTNKQACGEMRCHLGDRCTGSACMQWRWLPLGTNDHDAFDGACLLAAEVLDEKGPKIGKVIQHVRNNRGEFGLATKPTEGYCGLSGKPEA